MACSVLSNSGKNLFTMCIAVSHGQYYTHHNSKFPQAHSTIFIPEPANCSPYSIRSFIIKAARNVCTLLHDKLLDNNCCKWAYHTGFSVFVVDVSSDFHLYHSRPSLLSKWCQSLVFHTWKITGGNFIWVVHFQLFKCLALQWGMNEECKTSCKSVF